MPTDLVRTFSLPHSISSSQERINDTNIVEETPLLPVTDEHSDSNVESFSTPALIPQHSEKILICSIC